MTRTVASTTDSPLCGILHVWGPILGSESSLIVGLKHVEEIFFVDLPVARERALIWEIALEQMIFLSRHAGKPSLHVANPLIGPYSHVGSILESARQGV